MALININYESKTLGMPVMINAIIPQIKDDAAQSAAENKNLTVVSGTAQ